MQLMQVCNECDVKKCWWPGGPKTEGLRERKRRETRERIAQAGLALFLERGFDATTVDDIAAAADVSKRSFFDYFPAKEDVVAAWQDQFAVTLAAAVAARPAGEVLARVAEEALTASITQTVTPQAMAIGQLIQDTPALSARDQVKYAKLERILADALAARAAPGTDPLRIRLLAMVAIGGLRVCADGRQERLEGETVEAHVRRVFATLWANLREFGHAGEAAGLPPR
jgi:AcrR family transcriptional regulator